MYRLLSFSNLPTVADIDIFLFLFDIFRWHFEFTVRLHSRYTLALVTAVGMSLSEHRDTRYNLRCIFFKFRVYGYLTLLLEQVETKHQKSQQPQPADGALTYDHHLNRIPSLPTSQQRPRNGPIILAGISSPASRTPRLATLVWVACSGRLFRHANKVTLHL